LFNTIEYIYKVNKWMSQCDYLGIQIQLSTDFFVGVFPTMGSLRAVFPLAKAKIGRVMTEC